MVIRIPVLKISTFKRNKLHLCQCVIENQAKQFPDVLVVFSLISMIVMHPHNLCQDFSFLQYVWHIIWVYDIDSMPDGCPFQCQESFIEVSKAALTFHTKPGGILKIMLSWRKTKSVLLLLLPLVNWIHVIDHLCRNPGCFLLDGYQCSGEKLGELFPPAKICTTCLKINK